MRDVRNGHDGLELGGAARTNEQADGYTVRLMNRRQFLFNATSTAAGLSFARGLPDQQIKRVLVMFKCHLDVGFVDTQQAIIKKYFEVYFPQAIQLAADQRAKGEERYIWTTGSWLVYEYLEQAAPAERKRMEEALTNGDVAWHALPFTWQTELLDVSAIEGCVGLSHSLDQRFGKKTTGAKMTDVPGHCRGLIQPLAKTGVTLLDIGVNAASTPPDVPNAFVWKDNSNGTTITMLYHQKSYGGVIKIPRSDLAIAVEMRDDNAGPHTPEEIHQIYSDLRQQFPAASIQAANLTDIANAVEPFRANLPVVTQEIGDTWIHGVASDPPKLARIRELVRLRSEWISQGKLKIADSTDLAFLSKFALAVEHTWGTDTKTWLDFDHYTPDDLASMLGDSKYRTVTGSWVEKRADIDDAVAALPANLREEAEKHLAALHPGEPPDTQTLAHHDATAPFKTTHFNIGIDPVTGAITDLRYKDRRWASAQRPLALLSYQTLSKADFDKFLASYITSQADWAPKDFGKPKMEKFGPQSRVWTPKLTQCWAGETPEGHRLVAQLEFGPQDHSSITAWPERCYLDLLFPKDEAAIHVQLKWFCKRANRLPEALWFSFNPAVFETQNWTISKVGETFSPFDVISGGNRHMHAVSDGAIYKDSRGSLEMQSRDAAIVSLGEMSPIPFSKAQPDLSKGIHFNLYNNAWGTNYIQWFGEDMLFRFKLRAG